MKTLITFNFVLLMVLNAFSQRAPEAFLARIPALPAAACDMPTKEKEKYLNKVIELSEQIKEKISEMKQERQDFADNNVEKMQKNMAKQMGLPPGDMAKMNKGGQLSEAEAMAMADKMMKEKYNMSLGEAKNLEKMGKEGKQAWGEAYGTEVMADAQANPNKFNADQTKNMKTFDLAAEQTRLVQQIQAEGNKFYKQMNEINTKDSLEKIKLERNIAPLVAVLNTINDGEGSTETDAARAYGLLMKIYEFHRDYCGVMATIYVDFLVRRLASVKMNLPVHYRLQEITDKQTSLQTGVEIKGMTPDLMAWQSISDYLSQLDDIFRFNRMEKPTRD